MVPLLFTVNPVNVYEAPVPVIFNTPVTLARVLKVRLVVNVPIFKVAPVNTVRPVTPDNAVALAPVQARCISIISYLQVCENVSGTAANGMQGASGAYAHFTARYTGMSAVINYIAGNCQYIWRCPIIVIQCIGSRYRQLPATVSDAPRVVVIAVGRLILKLFNPPVIKGIVVAIAVVCNIKFEFAPPVKLPLVIVMPPSRVNVFAPILSAPLVSVSDPAAVLLSVIELFITTPFALFTVNVANCVTEEGINNPVEEPP